MRNSPALLAASTLYAKYSDQIAQFPHGANGPCAGVVFVDAETAERWVAEAPWIPLTSEYDLELARATWPAGTRDPHGHGPSELRTHAFICSLL